MGDKPQIIRDLERALKAEYLGKEESDDERLLSGLLKFSEILKKKTTLKLLIPECGMMIFRLFPFKEIGIGLWNPADRAYRYEFLSGHSPVAQEAHKGLRLSLEDMMGEKDYAYIQLSKYTQLNYTEGMQEDVLEKHGELYNRPSLLSGKRTSNDILLEGDYFDIYFFSSRDEVMGWIEVSNTKDNKVPPMKTIKWLELFACMLAPTIEKELGANRAPKC
jgi:hypothetical protein